MREGTPGTYLQDGLSRNRTFAPLDVFPADWPNSLGDFLSAGTFNFRPRIKPGTPTVLQVPAGGTVGRAAVAIQGRWRYVDVNVERTSPGGGTARSLDVWVTAADNAFALSGGGEVDNTDYSFALAITETGVAPTGVVLAQKVATAAWSGTAFTSVDALVGEASGTARHSSTHAVGATDPLTPADIGAVGQAALDTEAATRATADSLLALQASPVLTGNPTAPTPTAGDNDTSLATTAFVTSAIGSIPGAAARTRYVERTFTRSDEDGWPSSGVSAGSHRARLATGQSRTVVAVEYGGCVSGTGTVVKITRNGTDVAGLTGLTLGTSMATPATPNGGAVTLADGDRMKVIVTAQGSCLGGEVTLVYADTI